jgi:hypothetical protein
MLACIKPQPSAINDGAHVFVSMLEWNEHLDQILAGVGEVAKLSLDTMRGYVTLKGRLCDKEWGGLAPSC